MPDLNAYQQLRQQVMQSSTRHFNARGILAERCERCQLALRFCICQYRTESHSDIDLVLIMHRDELFKPTNSGRLIADRLPGQTYAFLWDRLAPPAELLALLQDPARQCLLVFPADAAGQRPVVSQPEVDNRRITLVLLDGTWKQGRRMFNLSPWLKDYPALHINPAARARYTSRSAAYDHYLSTAESAALALAAAGDQTNSTQLLEYFYQFNRHYGAMRKNMAVEHYEALGRIDADD